MNNYSSNLIGFIKAATSQTPSQIPSVPGAPSIPANPLPGYNNANAARQRRQQYAQQQQASAAQHGAALRAHEKAREQAAKAQEAYLNQSRKYRAEQNEPLVYELRGYQPPEVKLKNTSGIFTQKATTKLSPHGPAIVGAISDYKLLNNGTLPTQEQAYGMADKAIENANKQKRLLRDDDWQLEEGEEKKIRDHVNDIIYKLYQPQPWGGRYVDEIVRANTNPQGYPIA